MNIVSHAPDEAMLHWLAKAHIDLKIYSIIEKFESSPYKYYQTEWETCIYINVVDFRCKNSKVVCLNILYIFVLWGW